MAEHTAYGKLYKKKHHLQASVLGSLWAYVYLPKIIAVHF